LQQKAGTAGGRITYRSFPGLNHLFMKVERESTGAEYGISGHVDPSVIGAIGDWVLAHLGGRGGVLARGPGPRKTVDPSLPPLGPVLAMRIPVHSTWRTPMYARSIRSRFIRIAAALAIPALVLAASASTASAAERHRGGYNHGGGYHGGGHGGGGY